MLLHALPEFFEDFIHLGSMIGCFKFGHGSHFGHNASVLLDINEGLVDVLISLVPMSGRRKFEINCTTVSEHKIKKVSVPPVVNPVL